MKHTKRITRKKHFKRSVLLLFCCAWSITGLLCAPTSTFYSYENNLTTTFRPNAEKSLLTDSDLFRAEVNSKTAYATLHELLPTETSTKLVSKAAMMPDIGFPTPFSPTISTSGASVVLEAKGSGVYQPFGSTAVAATLSCNDNLQISLTDNCDALITPDMILEGDFPDYSIFNVTVSDGPLAIANPVTQAFEGEVLTVEIFDTTTGNSCEGTIVVEDKQAPEFACPAAVITLDCTTNANDYPAPVATDNCDGIVNSQLVDIDVTTFSCSDASGLIRRVVREYTAFDANGNQTSTNCIQTIETPRADLINVLFPADALFTCGTTFDTSPAGAGQPTLNGVAITGNSVCNFITSYNDEVIETCGDTYKIIRSWTVLDWCNASSTPTNTILGEQIIKIQDNTPPAMTCPPSFTVSTNEEECTATTQLPAATITDECGSFTSQVFAPTGILTGNVVSNLGIGNHMIIYTSTDECGNFAECPTTITVEDAETPIMVCDELTQVTLNETGIAEVPAEEFDDGSYDACFGVDFSIRRMDGNGIYLPTVSFDCDDTSAPVEVELQAEDAFGNVNSCMVTVLVEDKAAPVLSCSPNDITIECTQNFEDFFTAPTIEEACQVFPLQFFTVENINSCGTGSVSRTYVVTDASGNTTNCIKTITLINSDVLELSDIDFPDDFDSAMCGTTIESLAPDSLPQPFSVPVIDEPACSQVAISVDDEVFSTDGACLKIFRTWTVIDWCVYDPDSGSPTGIFSDVQEITVNDTVAPLIVCPPDPFMKIVNPVCDTTIFVFGPENLQDCSPHVQLSSSLQRLPISDPANVLMTSDGLGPYEDLAPGSYQVFLFADDGCGNSSACDYLLTVQDNKAPTPYCFDTLVIALMETGMIEVNIQDFDAGSFDNCTAPEDLLFSYSANPFDSVMVFTCNNVGPNDVTMVVTDEGMNQDACLVTLVIQNNLADCGQARTVSGFIHTESLQGVADVMVSVNDEEAMVSTDQEGLYSINLSEGGDYTLLPEKDINPMNGITTFDAVLIRQHVLGLAFLDSPYKMIAADINNSGSITTADVVALRRLVLGLDDDFEFNTSWRFVDADYVFPNPANPFESGFPEFININNLTEDSEFNDFIAVKIGDVNDTASGLNFNGNEGEERAENTLIFSTENQILAAGESTTVWLEADTEGVIGWQGTLDISEKLTVEDLVFETGITTANAGEYLNRQRLTFSWENAAGMQKRVKFGLTLRAKELTDLQSALKFTDAKLRSEAYYKQGGSYTAGGLGFVFQTSRDVFTLEQNKPNPFKGSTSLGFYLPEGGLTDFIIYDAAGREIYSRTAEYSKGLHQINIGQAELKGTKGLLFYQLKTSNFSEVRRMLVH